MSRLPDTAAAALRSLLEERFSTHPRTCADHGTDEGHLPPRPPDAVAFPASTAETSTIARICSAHRIPMIPYGAGTSLEGQVMAPHGGLSLDFSGMDRILAVHQDDMDARVETGVTRRQLNRHLKHSGLFFSVDPGADASLGGMASTRASGTNTVRYGTIRDNIIGLTVVLADGRIIHTGRRVRKSATGYDLTALFIGAEGTLGIITELIVRLHPQGDRGHGGDVDLRVPGELQPGPGREGQGRVGGIPCDQEMSDERRGPNIGL